MSTRYQQYRNELAGAYVLGTLIPQVHRRLERHLQTDAELAAEVVFWEAQFAQLALDQIVAVEPPAHLHGVIRQRLQPAKIQTPEAAHEKERPVQKPGRFAWLFPAVTALAAGFLLAVLLRPQPVPEPQPILPAQFALVSAESGEQLWLIGFQADGQRMEVRNIENRIAPTARDYELWALAKDDSAPVSLGLLPGSAIFERDLSEAQQIALANAKAVAISEEPSGGSTTGTPTGPVLFSAPLQNSRRGSTSS